MSRCSSTARTAQFEIIQGDEKQPFRFREHRPEDLLTRLGGVAYEPSAACPMWLAFLRAASWSGSR